MDSTMVNHFLNALLRTGYDRWKCATVVAPRTLEQLQVEDE
jgi:hypothetical protein